MQEGTPVQEYKSVKRFHKKGFKGHKVNPAKQSTWRRDGLTNKQRVQLQRAQRAV